MAEAEPTVNEITALCARYPEHAAAIRERAEGDELFRSVCEDLALARAGLRRFEDLADAARRPEPHEYRAIIRELEAEIAGLLGIAAPDP